MATHLDAEPSKRVYSAEAARSADDRYMRQKTTVLARLKMTRKLFASLAFILIVQPAYAQNGTRNGAVLGGVGGAVIGGIIGHQNDETPEGALIGGAVGAVAGGLLGNAREKQLERDRYYQQQRWNQQQQWNHQQQCNNYSTYRNVPGRTAGTRAPGVTTGDVLTMTRSGVGESVIINHIYSTGIQRRIDTNEIIMLHQQGVTENVINAMQQAPIRSAYSNAAGFTGSSATTIMTPPGGTVIVQEQVGTPTYTASTYGTPTYSSPSYATPYNPAPDYSQPPYSKPTYSRPSHYQTYPPRRGF